jgi:hypothetical protein
MNENSPLEWHELIQMLSEISTEISGVRETLDDLYDGIDAIYTLADEIQELRQQLKVGISLNR